MAPVLYVIIAVVLVAALAIWLIGRRNRHADGVDSFRRQIDALSPEARRSTVEQLNVEHPDTDRDPEEPTDG